MDNLALHKFNAFNSECLISTVKIFNEYETMVLCEDGAELDCCRSASLEAAKEVHASFVKKWNDEVYNSSCDRFLGIVNHGQYVKPIIEF